MILNKKMSQQISLKTSLLTASTVNKFSNVTEYNQVKLYITSGVISHINTQLCASFTDFFGLLIGNYKVLQNTKSSDNHSNVQQNVLSLIVDNVIFIYDRSYLKDKLEKLLDKITKNSLIIGLFSARTFSYPNISLREQEFFTKTNNILMKDKNLPMIPLLFGCFCHNTTEETIESKVKTVNFYSRVYIQNEESNEFNSIPYEVINIKETSYSNKINLLADKTIRRTETAQLDSIVSLLTTKITEQIDGIESQQMIELKELKAQLKSEIETNKKLYDKLKSYET